jgi:RNA polymerase sigma factor (sigma-70 family)
VTEPGRGGDTAQVQSEAAAEAGRGVPRDEQFRAIYRAEFDFVWAVARRFGVPAAALDDAVQEVFLTAFRRLDGLRYEVSPRAWLYAVTRKIASRHHRGSTRLARRVAAFAEVAVDASEAPHARHEAAQQLEQLLALLPRGTREVWEMTEVLGMSGPEIAGELQLPLNTVYSRLRLARAQLLAHSAASVADCVAAARRGEAPPAGAARRNWAMMLPVMGKGGGLATTAGAVVTGHPALAATLIAVGAAVVTMVVTTVVTTVGPGSSRGPAPTEQAPRVRVEAAPVRGELAAVAVSEAPRARDEVTPPRVVGSRDHLAAEVALLDRARALLAAGDPSSALAVLAGHAREFPAGALLDAREAARVEALCRQGQGAAAEERARQLFTSLPESLLARRFEHYVCTP